GLGGNDVEVRIEPQLVAVGGDRQQPLGRRDRRILLFYLLRQDPQRGQVVLHLLKRGQHGLPVSGHGLIVSRLILLHRRTAQPGVEQRFGQRRAYRPETVG